MRARRESATRGYRRRLRATRSSCSPGQTGFERLETRSLLTAAPFVAASLVSSGDEASGADTVFEIRRTGDTASPLSVNLILTGTATPGADYTPPAAMQSFGRLPITIPANQPTVRVMLPTLVDAFYDPGETIQLIVQPGAAYKPQPGGDRAVALLGADGVAGTVVDPSFDSASGTQIRNKSAFAAIRSNGSVVTWGSSSSGGSSSGVDFDGPNNTLTVRKIFSTSAAFAALRSDGSVVTWGDATAGGDSSGVDFNGTGDNLSVTRIASTGFAFAAVRSDGSVVTWGRASSGGNSSGIDFDGPGNNLAVMQIVSSNGAFAALRSNGSVVTWGEWSYGGDSSGVDFDGASNTLTITQIVSGGYGFAALRSDGAVLTWGNMGSSNLDFNGPNDTLAVTRVFANSYAFAALRSDGSVLTWGDAESGGDSSSVDFNGPSDTLAVTRIIGSDSAFAALRSDGSVVTWGGADYGGNSSGVDFNGAGDNLTVTQIVASTYAFAAIRSDGSVVTWGFANWGGNSSGVDFGGADNTLTVTQIVSNGYAFAAIRSNGSVVTWGESSFGGSAAGVDFDGPNGGLTVSRVFSTYTAFAAVRSDGSVVTWGDSLSGGTSTGVDFDGPNNNLDVAMVATPFLDATVTIVAPPSAPVITTALPRNGLVKIRFTPPTSNGGSAITNYKYSVDDGRTYIPLSPAATSSLVIIPGLVNGITYQIRLRAVNAAGDGTPSAAVLLTPRTIPSPPAITAATRGNRSVRLTFTPPTNNGGSAVTNYVIQHSRNNGGTWVTVTRTPSTATSVVVTGLVNNKSYIFRVAAITAAGQSPFSPVSPRVTPRSR